MDPCRVRRDERDPLLYVGMAQPDGRIVYELPARVRAAQVGKRYAGTIVEVEIREFQAQRSARQNRGFHAMVAPWAKERGWEIEALKQFLLKRVFGVLEFVDPQTGGVTDVLAEPHTSSLKVSQFSELIERALELAAYDGVMLTAPSEYRRQQEAARKRAERKQVKAAKAKAA